MNHEDAIERIEYLERQLESCRWRLAATESEAVALATANSELRSEVAQLKTIMRSVTHG